MIKAVVMDKTGTITKGDFTVQKIVGGDELLELCASCEQQSTHPIAESIVAAAKQRGMALRRPEELEEADDEDPLADLVLAGKTKPRLRLKLDKDGKTLKF